MHKDYAVSDNDYSIIGEKPKLTDEQNNALKIYKNSSDFKVNVIEDACAAANKTNHNASIETLSRVANIVKSTEL